MKKEIIAIGGDHSSPALKADIIQALQSWSYEVVDCGTYSTEAVDYPDIAKTVCQKVVNNECQRGIVICGTGIGISVASNKIKGIRCALCSEGYSARMSREHNNSNVLALGARTIGVELALEIVKIWMESEFDGAERSCRRVNKIMELEN